MLAMVLVLAQLQPLPPSLVPLSSEAGEKLLFTAESRAHYFPLAGQFVTQRSTAFCGVASAVMALNALPLQAPVAAEWAPFRSFTQDNVFASAPFDAALVQKGGLTVEQLAALLRANGTQVEARHASASSLDAFRGELRAALLRADAQVLADFSRPELGQDMGAHWSPLAAYDQVTDRALVMDVARFRYPPYWASVEQLFHAMNTLDLDSGQSRGWLVVTPSAGAAPRAEIPPLRHRIWMYGAVAIAVLLAIGGAIGFLLGRRTRRAA